MVIDLLKIVADVLRDSEQPVSIQDNRYSSRESTPADPIGMVCASPPAYHVLVAVNYQSGYVGPWLSVTHTERFGFTPIGTEHYTYLEPPKDVDRGDLAALAAWLAPELHAAVAAHAPRAAAAQAADAGKSGPVQAWEAIREVGR